MTDKELIERLKVAWVRMNNSKDAELVIWTCRYQMLEEEAEARGLKYTLDD